MWGGSVRTAEYLLPSNANFKRWQAVFINVVTYYPGLLGGRERKRERKNPNIAAFDACESRDPLNASLGRGHLTTKHQSRMTVAGGGAAGWWRHGNTVGTRGKGWVGSFELLCEDKS